LFSLAYKLGLFLPSSRSFEGMGYNRNAEYLVAFGKHFRKLRNKSGISQENLALEADVDYQVIYRIEKGINNPTISTLLALSKAIGVHPRDFLDFDFPQQL